MYIKVILETDRDDFCLPGLIYQEKLEAGRRLLLFETFPPEARLRLLGEIIEVSKTEPDLLKLGSGLAISPLGPPAPDRLVIKTGGAFGSGFHPTTRLCLEILDTLPPAPGIALDLGTGTGILALLLAHKGWARVLAVDVDPKAVAVLKHNIEQNSLGGRVFPLLGDLTALKGPFALVVANLYLRLLIPGAVHIRSLLASGGRLVLSGFLASSLPAVKRAYAGLIPVKELVCQGWAAVSFVIP